MKLEIARGLFLVGALGVATAAFAAWEEPGTEVLSAAPGAGHCPLPRLQHDAAVARPQHENLFLLILGLQGSRAN